ncbi:hypothetical protein [Amycolatopsis sp. NPDC051716]|uniref:hypothetical protein n=1 Tax=Amycolatopsis sp. NPDC051716 TaxID=3155804 RepID=UPI003433FAB9
MVELLAHRTGAPEPLLRHRLPAWLILPGYRHRLLAGRGRRRQASGVADPYPMVNQQSDNCVHVNGASVLQWTHKSISRASRLNQTWRL